MSDVLTPVQRHRNMAAIHSASTKPELCLRHALWQKGFRYRVNDKRLPGSPDIVLPKYRTVIFVHGCFWHGHINCRNFTIPKTNAQFWLDKIIRNQTRDQEVWRLLEAKGWMIVIVWECQLKKQVLEDTLSNVCEEILHNGKVLCAMQDDRKVAREEYRNRMRAHKKLEDALKKEIQ